MQNQIVGDQSWQIPPIAVNPFPGIGGWGFVGLAGLVGLSLMNYLKVIYTRKSFWKI